MARPLPSRLDRCVRTMELMMRRVLIAAILAALFGCIPAFAQVDGMGSPPPGIGATSPFGTGFSGFAADLQSATLPYSGTVNPAPCSTGNLGMAALPTFDGGGISLSTNSAVSELPGPYGVGTSTSAPCNSVSSSGLMSYPSSVTATSTSASASSPSSPSSSSVSSLDVSGVGIAGLAAASAPAVSARPASAHCRPCPDRRRKRLPLDGRWRLVDILFRSLRRQHHHIHHYQCRHIHYQCRDHTKRYRAGSSGTGRRQRASRPRTNSCRRGKSAGNERRGRAMHDQ